MHLRTLLLGILVAAGLGLAAEPRAPLSALQALAQASPAEAGSTPAGEALERLPSPGQLQRADGPLQPFLAGGWPGIATPAPEAPAARGPRLTLVPRLRLAHAHAHASALTCNRQHRELTPVLRRSRLPAPAFSSGTPPPVREA